jgi:hypothetical protein
MHGVAIDSTMGVNIWAAFVGSDENAVVDGTSPSPKRIATSPEIIARSGHQYRRHPFTHD